MPCNFIKRFKRHFTSVRCPMTFTAAWFLLIHKRFLFFSNFETISGIAIVRALDFWICCMPLSQLFSRYEFAAVLTSIYINILKSSCFNTRVQAAWHCVPKFAFSFLSLCWNIFSYVIVPVFIFIVYLMSSSMV